MMSAVKRYNMVSVEIYVICKMESDNILPLKIPDCNK